MLNEKEHGILTLITEQEAETSICVKLPETESSVLGLLAFRADQCNKSKHFTGKSGQFPVLVGF